MCVVQGKQDNNEVYLANHQRERLLEILAAVVVNVLTEPSEGEIQQDLNVLGASLVGECLEQRCRDVRFQLCWRQVRGASERAERIERACARSAGTSK